MSRSNCDFDVLQEYLDGVLPRAQQDRVEAHLEGCPECSAALDSYRRVFDRLSSLNSFAPSPDFDYFVLSAVVRRSARFLGLPLLGWVGLAYLSLTSALFVTMAALFEIRLSANPALDFARMGEAFLRGYLQLSDRAHTLLDHLRDYTEVLSGLMGLARLPLRVLELTAATPDGRLYLALSIVTALGYLMFSRRSRKGGSYSHAGI